MIRKQAAKSKLNSVDITPTFERQNGLFLAQRRFTYAFYSVRECHYLKRTRIEIK